MGISGSEQIRIGQLRVDVDEFIGLIVAAKSFAFSRKEIVFPPRFPC